MEDLANENTANAAPRVRDDCAGDLGVASEAFALVHSPSQRLPRSRRTIPPGAEKEDERDPLLARAYEGFLELPVPVVLGAMWLAGAAPVGVLVLLALYLT